jgi:hypothetical protein
MSYLDICARPLNISIQIDHGQRYRSKIPFLSLSLSLSPSFHPILAYRFRITKSTPLGVNVIAGVAFNNLAFLPSSSSPVRSGGRLTSNCRMKSEIVATTSTSAKRRPMQARGPAEKGTKASRFQSRSAPGRKREGLKVRGSSQWRGLTSGLWLRN